jgi:hypothetical protein
MLQNSPRLLRICKDAFSCEVIIHPTLGHDPGCPLHGTAEPGSTVTDPFVDMVLQIRSNLTAEWEERLGTSGKVRRDRAAGPNAARSLYFHVGVEVDPS